MIKSSFVALAVLAIVLTLAFGVEAIVSSSAKNGDRLKSNVQGYQFASDVSEFLNLEKAVIQLEKLASTDSTPESLFVQQAEAIISQSFGKLNTGELGEPTFNLYAAYWGRKDFAANIVSSVTQAREWFMGIKQSALSRLAGATEAVRYHILSAALVHELEVAHKQCQSKSSEQARKAWDRAAAMYLGNGVDTAYSRSSVGKLLFKLSNELCQTARTCISDDGMYGDSKNNRDILAAFNAGAGHISNGKCDALATVKATISKLILIPSLQFLVKQSYKLDPKKNGFSSTEDKARAYVHVLSLLPRLQVCDAEGAEKLASNFHPSTSPYLPYGYLPTADLIASFLPCLELNCEMLGGYTSYYVAEIEQCLDPKPVSNEQAQNKPEDETTAQYLREPQQQQQEDSKESDDVIAGKNAKVALY